MSKIGDAALRWFEATRERDLADKDVHAAETRREVADQKRHEAKGTLLQCVGQNIPVKAVSIPGTSYVVVVDNAKASVSLLETEDPHAS